MSLRFDNPGPHRDRDGLYPGAHAQLRAHLLKVAVDRARRQSEDGADISRALAATDPQQALKLSRAQGENSRADIRLEVRSHDFTRD